MIERAITPPIKTDLLPLELPDGRILRVKNEAMQHTGAFKFRGNYNYLSQKHNEIDLVVTASSGNHASGLAKASEIFNIHAIIFLPEATPESKMTRIIDAGAETRMVEGTYENALLAALEFAEENEAVFIPSYDHPLIIDGNRILFDEIEEQMNAVPEYLFVQIGGGGILAGALNKYNELPTRPEITAVEFEPFARIDAIINKGMDEIEPPKDGIPPSLEGIAIRTLGEIPKTAITSYIDLVVKQVDFDALCEAARLCFDQFGIRAELGGCAGIAAAMQAKDWEKNAVAVITGGNIDLSISDKILNGDI